MKTDIEKEIDKKLHKLKLYLLNNDHCNIEIHRQANSIIWKQQTCENTFIEDVDRFPA